MNCAVPLFLALSGFFAARKRFEAKPDKISYWKKTVKRVYVPMLIWGIGWFVLDLWRHPVSGGQLIKSLGLLFAGGFSVYYFVILIIQCYLLTPWLSKRLEVSPTVTLILCGLMSIVAITFTTYYLNVEGMKFPLLLYAGPVYLWIIFFVIGMYIARYPTRKIFIVGIVMAIIGYVLSGVETSYYLQLNDTGVGIKPSSFLFSAGVILVLLSNQVKSLFVNSRFTRIFSYIGEVSFGIYLMHTYVILICGKAIGGGWALRWIVATIVTFAIILIFQKILPRKWCRNYFGIG